jgi:hypothetical protein
MQLCTFSIRHEQRDVVGRYPARKHSVLVVLGSIPAITRSRGMYIHVGGSNPEVDYQV